MSQDQKSFPNNIYTSYIAFYRGTKSRNIYTPTNKPHSSSDVRVEIAAGSVYVSLCFDGDISSGQAAIQDPFPNHNLWEYGYLCLPKHTAPHFYYHLPPFEWVPGVISNTTTDTSTPLL